MFRSWYFYALAPIFVVMGITVLLVIPYLAVIVLLAVVLAALYGLVRGVVGVSHAASAAVGRRRHRPAVAARPAPVLAPARRPSA